MLTLMPRSPGKSVQRIAVDHLGLAVSALLGLIVVLRLLVLAAWDIPTAEAVLQHAGAGNVVLSAVIGATPAILELAMGFVTATPIYLWRRDGEASRNWISIAVLAFTFSLTFVTPFAIGMMLALWLAAFVFGKSDRTAGTDGVAVTRQSVINVFAGVLLSTFVIGQSPWLPRESIEIGERDAFAGFVLSGGHDSTWVVLHVDPRRIEFIPPGRSRERGLCGGDDGWLFRPVIDWIGGDGSRPDYPDCPKKNDKSDDAPPERRKPPSQGGLSPGPTPTPSPTPTQSPGQSSR